MPCLCYTCSSRLREYLLHVTSTFLGFRSEIADLMYLRASKSVDVNVVDRSMKVYRRVEGEDYLYGCDRIEYALCRWWGVMEVKIFSQGGQM